MPKIDVQLETAVVKSFRVDQVAGLFDVSVEAKSRLELSVHVPAIEGPGSDWRIGVVVGPSGCGKTSIARQAWGERFIEAGFDWPADRAVVDAFDKSLSMQQVTGALNAVGFSSPPAWVLPYRCLSTGQRMRCDLARALLRDEPVIAFDEFTSVVDRQVGRFASAAVAKAIRKQRVPLERFVAVTCHHDVIDWLEPDWVLEVAERRLTASPGQLTNAELPRGCLRRRKKPWRRPAIEIDVRRCPRRLWTVFGPHHYLSTKLHPIARCYAALWETRPVAFCATLPNAGWTGRRLIHRLVVLPDYQGLGIGLRLLDQVAGLEDAGGYSVSIRTSHPALIGALRRRQPWRLTVIERIGSAHSGFTKSEGRTIGSAGRCVAGFRYARPTP